MYLNVSICISQGRRDIFLLTLCLLYPFSLYSIYSIKILFTIYFTLIQTRQASASFPARCPPCVIITTTLTIDCNFGYPQETVTAGTRDGTAATIKSDCLSFCSSHSFFKGAKGTCSTLCIYV